METLGTWQTLALGSSVLVVSIALLMQATRAQKTGIAHFFLQWPNDFSRDTSPWQFWLTMALAIGCGVMGIAFSVFCFVSLFGVVAPIQVG